MTPGPQHRGTRSIRSFRAWRSLTDSSRSPCDVARRRLAAVDSGIPRLPHCNAGTTRRRVADGMSQVIRHTALFRGLSSRTSCRTSGGLSDVPGHMRRCLDTSRLFKDSRPQSGEPMAELVPSVPSSGPSAPAGSATSSRAWRPSWPTSPRSGSSTKGLRGRPAHRAGDARHGRARWTPSSPPGANGTYLRDHAEVPVVVVRPPRSTRSRPSCRRGSSRPASAW